MKQGNDQQTQKKTQRDKNGNFKQKTNPDFPPKIRSGDAKAVGKGEAMLYGALAPYSMEMEGMNCCS